MEPALANLCQCLDEFAGVSDAIREAEHVPGASERITELLERSETLRARLAKANAAAAGCNVPPGSRGAAILATVRSCKSRIVAGDQARERIVSFRDTVNGAGTAFAMHVIANLPPIAAWPSAARLRGAFQGRPAVIVGAGPSLDKNIEVLHRFKGKAVIIAVSHSLLALERAGIVPDIAIAIDPADIMHHFAGASVDKLGALLLATSFDPRGFDLPARRFLTVGANAGLDTWAYRGLEEDIFIPTGGSVANTAFSLLHLWGCNPIILVGQDLSFPDGRYYASTTCDGDAMFEVSPDGTKGRVTSRGEASQKLYGPGTTHNVRRVPGYHGGEVVTDFGFHMAWKWFVDATKNLDGRVTLLNCTEGGARIEGMEHVKLEEAVTRYATTAFSVEQVLDKAVWGIDRAARKRLVLRRVKEMRTAVERCLAQGKKCKALAERAKRRPELLAQLGQAEAKLTSALESIEFVATAVQREIRAALALGKDAGSSAKGLDASLRMYEVITDVVLKTGPLLAVAELKLTSGL